MMHLSKRITILILTFIAGFSPAVHAQNSKVFYNVKDFGAKGDGANIDGGAINKAIEGFYIRHVKNLKMHDVQVSYMEDDFRPPFILDDVKGAILYDMQLEKNAGASSFILKNVKDIHISQTDGVKDVFIKNAVTKNL